MTSTKTSFPNIPHVGIYFLLCLLTGCTDEHPKEQTTPPNVLFIAIDDLNGSIGSFGDTLAITPNFDRLSNKGVRFDRAYCQLPLCNPSRASVMTGLRPDIIKVYDLDRHFREELPEVITLPQLFKDNGYWSGRVGKLYHYNVPAGIGTDGLDDPPSWHEVVNPKGRDTAEEHLITNAEPHRKISAALSWLAAAGADAEQTDGMVATEAIRLIKKHKDRPFFLGVGFYRPHTPYVAPKKYFDWYPLEKVQLPVSPENDREDIPFAAFAHNCQVPHYGLELDTCRRAKQAYYASVSFVDAQIGRVLRALEEEHLLQNTVVVVWSDHGYHLGEHGGIWQKRCLFEESARAPLIIYAPGRKGNGRACRQIVEFVDLYPTVARLCGLESPGGLSGKDLSPLLDKPDLKWRGTAFTQVLRPGAGNPVLGRSVRTDTWRYTEWNKGSAGSELYNHALDPFEFNNLAAEPAYRDTINSLKDLFEGKIDGEVPEAPFNPERL